MEDDAPSAMFNVESFTVRVDSFDKGVSRVGQCIGQIRECAYLRNHFMDITDCMFRSADCYDVVGNIIHVQPDR